MLLYIDTMKETCLCQFCGIFLLASSIIIDILLFFIFVVALMGIVEKELTSNDDRTPVFNVP